MKIYKKFTIFALLVFMSFLSNSCSQKTTEISEAEEIEVLPDNIVELRDDQIVMAGIQFGRIDSLSLSGKLKINGIVTVSAQNLATVCMPLGGFIKSSKLMPGNAVNKGQSLAILENQEFVDIQQEYLEAKIKLEYSEIEYNRHTELFKEEVYSQNNVQEVTAEYKNQKARVNALAQKLRLIGINPLNLTEDNISSSIELCSPISGYIQTVNVNVGKFVSPSDVLFEIVNSDKLLLELTLYEKDASKVKVGQRISFFINNETEVHEAIIYQTGKSISAEKTLKVYADVPIACENVLPGMYVNAIVETSTNKVTALPSEAIVSFDDQDYIFVFDKNKEEDGKPFTEYKILKVKKGVSDNGFTEVFLEQGIDIQSLKVVVKGAYNLLSAKKNAGEMAC